MKSLFFTLLLALSTVLQAQQTNIDDLFKKFDGKSGITTVTITKDLMKLAANIDTNDKDLQNLVDMISGVRILAFDNAQAVDVVAFNDALKNLSVADYKELMTVRSKDENVRMLMKDANGKVSDLLIIVVDGKSPALINITGALDLSKLGKLGAVHIDGFEHLAALKK